MLLANNQKGKRVSHYDGKTGADGIPEHLRKPHPRGQASKLDRDFSATIVGNDIEGRVSLVQDGNFEAFDSLSGALRALWDGLGIRAKTKWPADRSCWSRVHIQFWGNVDRQVVRVSGICHFPDGEVESWEHVYPYPNHAIDAVLWRMQ